MKTLTVQCLTISITALVVSVALLTIDVQSKYTNKKWMETIIPEYKVYLLVDIAKYVGVIVVCLLQIWGILKKYHLALIPFILTVGGVMGFTIFQNGLIILVKDTDYIRMVEFITPYLGIEFLVLYTTCVMFNKIKRQNVNEQKYQITNYYDKV
ncbi:uncharacterized protein [Musca autumnalis]|uniref:uncharacterized protein n=1 Tax=Musca autumnalis TaxID=221902 RepID=UPI003CFB278C